jgi:predicted Zn-dependent peptidase
MNALAKLIAKTCCIAVVCGSALAPGSAQSVKLPPYKKTVLKNGMTVLIMEQHKVPLVDLRLALRTGSTSDPIGKEGVAGMTAGLLRKGTKKYDALQISEALDSVGASFGAGAGVDSTMCSSQFMAKDISRGLDLFAELLMRPTFPEDEFQKLKAQSLDAMRASRDSASGVIVRYFASFFYGAHPYGRGSDEVSLSSMAHSDVLGCYKSHYAPSNAILVAVGDFKTSEMEKMISDRFGAWSSKEKPRPVALPKPSKVIGKKVLLVDKPDATQTYFIIGNVGVDSGNPDRVAIQVVNTLFGGRFTSMINTALRINSGLTYGANAAFTENKGGGTFVIVSFTANATTERAIDLALDTLKDLHENGITEEGLNSAKAYIKGSFPPQTFETSSQLASLLASQQINGRPDSEVNDFVSKVNAVTLADAKRIISTYYPLNDLCFVLVGKASEIRPIAEKYSKEVTEKSIVGPGF